MKKEKIKLKTREVELTLTQDCEDCQFPEWLKTRSEQWYAVLNEAQEYIGNVFFIQGRWKIFNTTVIDEDGKFDNCLIYLYLNN